MYFFDQVYPDTDTGKKGLRDHLMVFHALEYDAAASFAKETAKSYDKKQE